jgi:hypothetical protein
MHSCQDARRASCTVCDGCRLIGPWVAMGGSTPGTGEPKPPLEPTSCIRESAFTAAQQNDWRNVKSDGKAGSIKTGERGECGCIRIGLIPAWSWYLICIDSSFDISSPRLSWYFWHSAFDIIHVFVTQLLQKCRPTVRTLSLPQHQRLLHLMLDPRRLRKLFHCLSWRGELT